MLVSSYLMLWWWQRPADVQATSLAIIMSIFWVAQEWL